MSITSIGKRSSKISSKSHSQRESIQEITSPQKYFSRESIQSKNTLKKQVKEYVKPTLKDYHLQELQGKHLFTDVLKSSSSKECQSIIDTGSGIKMFNSVQNMQGSSEEQASILVTGFGMRNLQSLQNALEHDEEKRLFQLYKQQEEAIGANAYQLEEIKESKASTISSSTKKSSVSETSTETETMTTKSDRQHKFQLDYLLGLNIEPIEEGTGTEKLPVNEEEESFVFSTSVNMKAAQKYLRIHRIFDFFQFITSHLLGAVPEDPIAFILELLNKCLLYRSGLGKPPVLYEKKHIEQLFQLMDRMRTGYIELEQYHKGMHTLGICEYNRHPRQTQDGMVSKEDFVDEVFDAEIDLFDDLIKRKWIGTKTKPVSESKLLDIPCLSPDISGSHLFPSDLFKSLKTGNSINYHQKNEEFLE